MQIICELLIKYITFIIFKILTVAISKWILDSTNFAQMSHIFIYYYYYKTLYLRNLY